MPKRSQIRVKTIINQFLAAVAVLQIFACVTAAVAAEKTLIYCIEAGPEIFNPSLAISGASFDAALPVYNTLVEFERGGTRIVPGLAQEWTISPDGLIYEFKLRRGVKFHSAPDFIPSRDFNADDVLFSIKRQWRAGHPYHKVSGGNYVYFNSTGTVGLLKSVEKIDDFTVRIMLNQVEAPFLANLAMPFAAVLSAEYADAMAAKGTPQRLDHVPVGTGPFQFVGYQKDSAIRYKAFDRHWAGRTPSDNLVFVVTPDAAVRYARLKAGECHAAAHLNPVDLPSIRKDATLQLLETEGLGLGYLAFQTLKKPFDDVRVRRAVVMALDKSAIVAAVYQDLGKPAHGPLPPGMWSYAPSAATPSFDPARARELLAEAGYPDGFETDLWAMPVQRPYNPNARRMAEMIQADLAHVGIRVKIVTFEWSQYLKRIRSGEHQMALWGWISDNGDPDNFLHTLLSADAARDGGGNIAKWSYKPFDDLVVKAKREIDQSVRAKLYSQAQMIFAEQTPWAPIAYTTTITAVSRKMINYRPDPFGLHKFYGVDLAPQGE